MGGLDFKGLASGAVRSALCAAAMGAVVASFPGLHVLLRAAAGAVVYVILARFACPVEWNLSRKLCNRSDT